MTNFTVNKSVCLRKSRKLLKSKDGCFGAEQYRTVEAYLEIKEDYLNRYYSF